MISITSILNKFKVDDIVKYKYGNTYRYVKIIKVNGINSYDCISDLGYVMWGRGLEYCTKVTKAERLLFWEDQI